MVYDLRERVLPASVNCSTPSPDEHARHLITRYLQAHGLGQIKDVGHLRKGIKKQLALTAQQMLEAKELIEVTAANQTYFALPQQLSLLHNRTNKSRACILSPFDNLVIQRHRMRELFDFDYQIECYVTAAKRQHGYFVLPILWQGRLVARLDCKADRPKSCLRLHYLKAEAHVKDVEPLAAALRTAIEEFDEENALSGRWTNVNGFELYQAESVRIWCADFFALGAAQIGPVHAIFDRAALIALPMQMRKQYSKHLHSLAAMGCQQLLICLEYDQSKRDGPPFAVLQDEVQSLYPKWSHSLLASVPAENKSPESRDQAYRLQYPVAGNT